MARLISLDTCVLIAFADPANPFHDAAEHILESTEPLAITALAGVELLVHASEQQERWYALFKALSIDIVDITGDDMAAVAAARRESGLKMPDALVVWLARSRCGAVASFDQRLLDKCPALGIRTMS